MITLFAPYAHTLAALALWAILQLGLAGVSTMGKARARSAGGLPVRDYSDPAYRRHRAFPNATESSGAFVAAAVAAMAAGGDPFWVNLLASAFVAARVAVAAVHIGTEIQWLRSLFWTVGLLCILALAGIALAGAFAA